MQDLKEQGVPEGISSYQVKHLPIIAQWCRNIGIKRIADEQMPSRMNLSVGDAIIAMVMDTLSGRSPLYHLEHFFEEEDLELLFGKKLNNKDFNDDAIGRILDLIYEFGVEKFYTEVALNMIKIFGIDASKCNFDSTSINVWGSYEAAGIGGPDICHGYSKDKRPDLKQFMYSMTCVEGNIPILGKVEDGNSSDENLNNTTLNKVNNFLKRCGQDMSMYVADCKVVTEENLEILYNEGFVSRLPANYKEHDQVIEQSYDDDQWIDIGSIGEIDPSSKRQLTNYKYQEATVTLYSKEYRAIVVQSDAKDKRKEQALQKRLEKEEISLQEELVKLSKQKYHCAEDAAESLEKLMKRKLKYHRIEGAVTNQPVYKRGRVKEGQKREVSRLDYQIEPQLLKNETAIEKARKRNSCFVLISSKNEKTSPYNGADLLEIYKGQMGVENNFRFLKDPLIVNDTFLKKPERIEALGLIFILSLLVWNLIERSMRKHVKATEKPVIGFDKKKTYRPTTYMITWAFLKMTIIKYGNHRQLAWPLKENQKLFLQAMGLTEEVFTKVPVD